MKKFVGSPKSVVVLLGRNLLAFVIFWILSFAFVQFGWRVLGRWPASEAGQLLGCVAGIAIALRMRARVTLYFLAAMAAFSGSELTIHSVYGIRAAQGAPTHFAVMSAGVLGVGLGALLVGRNGRAPVSYPVTHESLTNGAGSTTEIDGATPHQRSNMPLQPTSSADRTGRFEPTVSAARG